LEIYYIVRFVFDAKLDLTHGVIIVAERDDICTKRRTYMTIVTKARTCVLFLSLNRFCFVLFCFFFTFYLIQRFYDRRVLIPIGQPYSSDFQSVPIVLGYALQVVSRVIVFKRTPRTRTLLLLGNTHLLLLLLHVCIIQFTRRRTGCHFLRAQHVRVIIIRVRTVSTETTAEGLT